MYNCLRRSLLYGCAAQVYDRLQIVLTEYGESYYNAMIPTVIKELTAKGLVEESDGAKCVSL